MHPSPNMQNANNRYMQQNPLRPGYPSSAPPANAAIRPPHGAMPAQPMPPGPNPYQQPQQQFQPYQQQGPPQPQQTQPPPQQPSQMQRPGPPSSTASTTSMTQNNPATPTLHAQMNNLSLQQNGSTQSNGYQQQPPPSSSYPSGPPRPGMPRPPGPGQAPAPGAGAPPQPGPPPPGGPPSQPLPSQPRGNARPMYPSQQGPPRPGYPPQQQSQQGPPQGPPQSGGAPPPPMGAAPPAGSPPHPQAGGMRPTYPSPPGGAPQPRPNMRPQPERPMPPQYSQNGGQQYQSQGGTPPARPGQPQPPMPPMGQQQQQQQQPQQQQMPSSMVPRPFNDACGKPRPFYHRGGSTVSDDRGLPTIPKSNSDFIAVDDGSATIRHIRLTANTIAADPTVMTKSGVPLAAVMTPFANPVPGEAPVPVIDYGDKQVGGPLRCERCNAYANPGFKFINGGAQFQCNLCGHVNNTPQEHFSPIASHTGQRMDADQRYELRMGSVEYIVGSPDYCIRPPRPASYLFAIDVSLQAVQSGLAYAAMMSIKSAIGANLLPGSGQGARIGIFTFDRNLHFFDARGADAGKSVTMQFVPDVTDPFVPVGGNALFLSPTEAVRAVESAIDMHSLSGKNRAPDGSLQGDFSAECALGSALQTIKQAFADCGGKAFVVAASLPTTGVSKLERRGGGATGTGEEREKALLKEATSDYDILGCELADVQGSVDLFLAPSSTYVDVATLSRLPRACGGRLHLFHEFNAMRDGASFHRSICTAVSEPRAFEALLRVRTSPGVDARGEFVGHFGRPQRGDDVAGPVFDASSTLMLELSVTSKLLDESDDNRRYNGPPSLYDDVCLQCAILFTDCVGRRRIRVHTMFAKKSTVLSEVFGNTDVDAIGAYLAKKAAAAVISGGSNFSKAWEAVTERTAQMFYVYRKHCTSSSLNGQLILPESLKTLPVMMLGLIKSAALRKPAVSMQSGDAVTSDERAAALCHLVSASPAEIAAYCYPRMFEVQTLPEGAGVPLPNPTDPVVTSGVENGGNEPTKSVEPISLPPTMMLSAESLTDNRILLIENGVQMVLWLGSAADRAVAESIIVGGPNGHLIIRGETAASAELTKDVSEHGKKVAHIIQRIVSSRKSMSRPQVVVRSEAGAGGEAKWVMPMLVEDRAGSGTHSYVEYLRHVHKRVMDKMANDSAQSDMQTWEMLNHGY